AQERLDETSSSNNPEQKSDEPNEDSEKEEEEESTKSAPSRPPPKVMEQAVSRLKDKRHPSRNILHGFLPKSMVDITLSFLVGIDSHIDYEALVEFETSSFSKEKKSMKKSIMNRLASL